jgi:hypothetical protein
MSHTKKVYEELQFLITTADDSFIDDVYKRDPLTLIVIAKTLLNEVKMQHKDRLKVNIVSSLDDDHLFNSDF